jgi:hypothetical protein
LYSGTTGVFPVVKTTLQDTAITIDESSSEVDASSPQVAGVTIVPSSFGSIVPTVALVTSTAAGSIGDISITLRLGNPLPIVGVMVLQLPATFAAVACDSAIITSTQPGSTVAEQASVTVLQPQTVNDVYTVKVTRLGTGSILTTGTTLTLTLNNVRNQHYSGYSGDIPMIKTVTADTGGATIDLWDSTTTVVQTVVVPIQGVTFTPAAFSGTTPSVVLSRRVAGAIAVTATVTVTVTNDVPVDGHIFIEFPATFDTVAPTSVVLQQGIDGTASVTPTTEAVTGATTVDIHRTSGTTVIADGTSLVVFTFNGIINQRFEGNSGTFTIWTTLNDGTTTIDTGTAPEVSDTYIYMYTCSTSH